MSALKTILIYALVVAVLMVGMLVYHTPAHWIYARYAEAALATAPIDIAPLQGTMYAGYTEVRNKPAEFPFAIRVERLRWQLKPAALLSGTARYEVIGEAVNVIGQSLGTVRVVLDYGLFSGAVMGTIRNEAGAMQLNARLEYALNDVDANNRIYGQITTQDATLENALRSFNIPRDGRFSYPLPRLQ